KFSLKMLSEALYETAKTTAMVLVIVIGATAFSAIFMALNGAEIVRNIFESYGLGQWGISIAWLVISFILGMFIDWVGIVMITFPIFLPVLETFDINMVWLMTCLALMLQTSFMTPPFGHALFYVKGIVGEKISTEEIYA